MRWRKDARYRQKRLRLRRVEGGLAEPVEQQGGLDEDLRDGVTEDREVGRSRSEQVAMLMRAVVSRRTMLVIRPVRRPILVPVLALGRERVHGRCGGAFVMYDSVAQQAHHRLRLGEGDRE